MNITDKINDLYKHTELLYKGLVNATDYNNKIVTFNVYSILSIITIFIIYAFLCNSRIDTLNERIDDLEYRYKQKNVAVYPDWSSQIQLQNDNK